MPLIPFPNIPSYPGVPPLPNPFPPGPGFLLMSDGPGVAQATEAPQWGIFKDGQPVIIADSVVSFGYDKEYRIADFPVEAGSFASYNKVERPYEERMIFAKGGSASEKATFLTSLRDAEASLDLYQVWTPDATYENANIVRVGFDRTSRNGATLLQVEVMVEEVRVATAAAFTNTASPSGVKDQSGGSVQAAAPTASQSAAQAQAPVQ